MDLLRKKYSLLGPLRYVEKSLVFVFFGIILLWLFRDPKVIKGWGNLFPQGYVTDGTVSIFVAMILFFLPAENPFTYSSISNEPLPTIMKWEYVSGY
jgi:sodium-dependent dicarboxylate transporter 2/3/5